MFDSSDLQRRPHQVLVVSDGTGVTGERVVQAAMTQFDPDSVTVRRIPDVRSTGMIEQVVEEASLCDATILFSLVAVEHRRHLIRQARRRDVAVIDILGRILLRLSDVLGESPRAQAGLFRQIDEEYFQRIAAVDFAVKHDDGSRISELDMADIVLVGVSRSSKTPLSMLLAYRGWRVANVPIVLAIDPPPELYKLDPSRVFALTAHPEWLHGVRGQRSRRMAPDWEIVYADMQHIREELRWFRHVCAKTEWTQVEVTHKAVEDTASEILALLGRS